MTRSDFKVFFLAVLARVAFLRFSGFTADDAFITFRYAENLASGLGFVYNAGEPVLGTSTPLFTLLLAGFRALQVPVTWGATVLLFMAAGVTAVLLHRFAVALGFGRAAWLPPVLYALWPRSLAGDTSGMEAALFSALVTGGFYAYFRRRPGGALSLAALASLTRPEGLLLVGILGLHHLVRAWRAKRLEIRVFVIPALLLVAWFGYAWVAFGSPIPHSIPAKLTLYERFFHEPFHRNVVWVLAWHHPVGWALTAAAVVGGAWLVRRRCFGIPEIAWLVSMVLFFSLSRTHLFFWYAVPLYPIYLLLGAAAWPALGERLPFLHRTVAQVVIAFALVPTLGLGAREQARHYRVEQDHMEAVHKAIGLHLAEHVEPEDLVAAEDIGYMGYFSGARILDRDGLVSPVAVPYNRAGNYLGLILDTAPDWVVVSRTSPTSGFTEDPSFASVYSLDRTFTHPPGSDYSVYRRR